MKCQYKRTLLCIINARKENWPFGSLAIGNGPPPDHHGACREVFAVSLCRPENRVIQKLSVIIIIFLKNPFLERFYLEACCTKERTVDGSFYITLSAIIISLIKITLVSVNKNTSNTIFFSEFSVFLKPASMNFSYIGFNNVI